VYAVTGLNSTAGTLLCPTGLIGIPSKRCARACMCVSVCVCVLRVYVDFQWAGPGMGPPAAPVCLQETSLGGGGGAARGRQLPSLYEYCG
jgi:hypothetical protein